jgi:hypothetical protein
MDGIRRLYVASFARRTSGAAAPGSAQPGLGGAPWAGYLLGASSFGWPLLIGGAVKIVYDVLLLVMFRKIPPPEEAPTIAAAPASNVHPRPPP